MGRGEVAAFWAKFLQAYEGIPTGGALTAKVADFGVRRDEHSKERRDQRQEG
jgi:hypothetical protein